MASDFTLGLAKVAKQLGVRANGNRLKYNGWTFEILEWESFLADDGSVQARPVSVLCLPPGFTFASLGFTCA